MIDKAAEFCPHVCLTFWGNLRHDARVVRTAAALVRAGARVTVICTDTAGTLAGSEIHAEGFTVQRVRRPNPRRIRVLGGVPVIGLMGALWAGIRGWLAHYRLARAAAGTEADIYHAADIFPLPVTWLVAKMQRRPLIYEAYEISTDREGFRPVVGLVRKVEGFLVRRSDAVFATTGMRADHFVREYGISKPRILQNRPPYRPAIQSDRIRNRCALNDKTVVVLYQGGLQPGRGLVNLIDIAGRVERAALVLIGGGMLEQSLKDRVEELGLQRVVHFLPPVPAGELHEWTCSADVGVQVLENTCLNHYTTDSNKLFEYIMAGLPVVASDFPEIRRVVAKHELGDLVDPADIEQIANAIQRLVDSPSLRRKLRENSLRAAPELSWETQVPVLLEAYSELGIPVGHHAVS